MQNAEGTGGCASKGPGVLPSFDRRCQAFSAFDSRLTPQCAERVESILAVKDDVVDVRPKLLDDIEKAIQADLRHPLLARLCPAALPRGVIQVG